jgi:hypothetical protein
MGRNIALGLIFALAVSTTGCSMVAPRYTASVENVQKLKDGDLQPAKVGAFESIPGKGNPKAISIRGASLNSPYDGSYGKYLAEALTQDLTLAGKLAADARIEISGVLQKNDINAAGFSTATGDIEARFVVKREGAVRYDQIKTVHDEWDSSFMGNVAIPRAQQRYPVVMQKLLGSLYADPAFLDALK